jgi:predicted nucleotidyltransferase
MNPKQAIDILTKIKPSLVKDFGVTRLPLFGSTVCNDAKGDSDVDIVIAFDGSTTSKKYFDAQFHPEDALGHPVDLISEKAMCPELRPYIKCEAISG